VPFLLRLLFDDLRDRPVQEQREQECGRHRLARGHALVSIREALHEQARHCAFRVAIEIRRNRRQQLT